MAKNKFFYNPSEIKELKELIRTGEPISRIAERECERFGTSAIALKAKMYELAKTTRKVRQWEGSKINRVSKQPVKQEVGIAVPTGTTFEGTPKRVVIFSDHFRIYF